MKYLIDKLEQHNKLCKSEWVSLISNQTPELAEYLASRARLVREQHYGRDTYMRGLIELTNYCKQNCYYCGIRKDNLTVERYRLSHQEVLACCAEGYELGFRTFVLQGGEDIFYTDKELITLLQSIRDRYPDCAITLSLGERSKESYQTLFDVGANRYLLRHETANHEHYRRLHPAGLTATTRQQCLQDLKEIGYQVGTGFMVGSPFQTVEHLAEDMLFLKELNPQMIGIGPFIPHHATPFCEHPAGMLELTLFMLSLLRLMLPKVLLPSTTSLGTIAPDGRERGILAGANVIMPNLSPTAVRKNYLLYDNKICTTDEAIQSFERAKQSMETIGYPLTIARGDSLNVEKDYSTMR